MTSRSVKRRTSSHNSLQNSLDSRQSSQTGLSMPEPHPAAISRAEASLVSSTSTDSYIDSQRSDAIEEVALPAKRASQSKWNPLKVTHPVAQGPIGMRADRSSKRTRSSFEEGNQESSSHNQDPISRKGRSASSRLVGLDAIIEKYGQLDCHDRTPASDMPSSSTLRQTAARQARLSPSQNSQSIPSSMNTGCTPLRMRALSQTARDARDPTDSNGNERGGRRERRTLGRTSGHGRNGYGIICLISYTSRDTN